MEETVPILRAQGDVKILGLMVSLNREEVGLGGKVSALQEIEAKWGFPAHAIVTMSEVIEYLGNPAEREEGAPVLTDDLKKALADYYAAYGAKKA